jgi:hypothetical protein
VVGVEQPADQVGRGRRLLVLAGQAAWPPRRVTDDVVGAHELLDTLVVGLSAVAGQLHGDPWAAVGAVRVGVDPADLGHEIRLLLLTLTRLLGGLAAQA